MKRIIAILLIAATSSVVSSAQTEGEAIRHAFEVGVGFNIISSYMTTGKPDRLYGPGVYFEYRENYGGHTRFGVQVNYKTAGDSGPSTIGETAIMDARCHQAGIKLLSDEYFCLDRTVNPFLGVNAGIGYLGVFSSDGARADFLYPSFGMRGGAAVKRFRIMIEFDCYLWKRAIFSKYARCLASSAAFTLGYSF